MPGLVACPANQSLCDHNPPLWCHSRTQRRPLSSSAWPSSCPRTAARTQTVPLAAVQKVPVRMEAPVCQVPMLTAVTASLGSKADTVSLLVRKCPVPAHGCSLKPSHFLSGKEMSATTCIRRSTKFTRTSALKSAVRAQASRSPKQETK